MAERSGIFIENSNEIGLSGKESVVVSSVGVLVHTGDPSFLLVERVDHPEDLGWSIPAGRPENSDKNPKNTGVREVVEETNLKISSKKLKPFVFVEKLSNESVVRAVYSYQCSLDELLRLGRFNKKQGILITSPDNPVSDEVRRLAIIPRFKLFDRGSRFITNYIKWDVMHHIKARLEGLRVI